MESERGLTSMNRLGMGKTIRRSSSLKLLTGKLESVTILQHTMKNRANEYEFQRLNADFDKKLDRLSDAYKRKADQISQADRYGLDVAKPRNRLWMWFDRKTRYQIIPKIVIISFGVTAILLGIVMVLLLRYNMESLFSIDLGAVFGVLSLLFTGELIVVLRVSGELEGRYADDVSMNIVTSPAWRRLKCNIWHRETDE
jgi:hypothetical protein